MKILALMPDAYGGFGGIAQFCRDLLDALSATAGVEQVASLPRHEPALALSPPARVAETPTPGNAVRYVTRAIWAGVKLKPDLILCGHINLLPAAALVKRVTGARLTLLVYGIDVWQRQGRVKAWAAKRVDVALAISRYTRERLLSWAGLEPHQVKVLSNAIHLGRYERREKPAYLTRRYALQQKRVLLSVGRLSASERYKGHDKMIALLPELAEEFPDLVYLVVGDGDDRPRLERLVEEFDVRERVVFAGQIPESEKIDHYNAADAFALPSTGEGFGFVFLEAAACGLPVLGGNRDGSLDALLDGGLGVAIDPSDPAHLLSGLKAVLKRGRAVPREIARFDFPRFQKQVGQFFVGL